MNDPRSAIKAAAEAALANSRYTGYKYAIRRGQIEHNMLGGEVTPPLDKGVIVAHTDGWYVQKTGVNKFVAHMDSLIPVEMGIGDKVEIQHAGFQGTSQKEGHELGMQFRSVTLSVERLQSPKKHTLLQNMTSQLSDMRLPNDGRRGLHLLSDLKYQNFRGDADNACTFNPYLEFEVSGAKFTGTVRMELQLGMDMYSLRFTGPDGTSELVENITFDDTLTVIEKHCDSSRARLASVKVITKAKAPKAPKPPELA